MTSEGLNRVRDLMSADMTSAELGTDGTAATIDDTGLGAAEANSIKTVAKTTTDRQLQADYELLSTEGATGTYREMKFYGATADFDRTVFSGISWTANGSENIAITKKYFYRGT